MIITNNSAPSKEALKVLQSLQSAVKNELDKKRKLGQYAVMWDGKKVVKVTFDKTETYYQIITKN